MTAFLDRLAPRLAHRPRRLALGAAAVALIALAGFAARDRNALWRITQACVADARWTGSPFPCLSVDLADGEARGHVIFRAPFIHDTVLVPTRKIVGVEDPILAAPDVQNYFADAWRARAVVMAPDGAPPRRERLLLAVNSALRRTQDQLHIHMGWLKPPGRKSLASAAPGLPVGAWRRVEAVVPHQPFWVLRLGRADLDGVDPFRVVFDAFGGVVRDPGQWTIGVAGATVAGEDDLLILASYAHLPGQWWPVGVETLMDNRCEPEDDEEPEGSADSGGSAAARQ